MATEQTPQQIAEKKQEHNGRPWYERDYFGATRNAGELALVRRKAAALERLEGLFVQRYFEKETGKPGRTGWVAWNFVCPDCDGYPGVTGEQLADAPTLLELAEARPVLEQGARGEGA